MTEPTDTELDAVLCKHWPAFSMQATLVRMWVRAAMRDAIAKWDTPPAEQQAMTVIDAEQWEPCSPSWIARGGDCAAAPRVWNAATCNHWHPKAAPKAAPGEPDKLMRDCLALLEIFDYEDDEDSQSKAFFNAHINADWFFHVKHSIERQLEAKAAPQQEAQEPTEVPYQKLTNEIDLILSDTDTELSIGAKRALLWMRTWVSVPLYLEAPQPAPAPLSEVLRDLLQVATAYLGYINALPSDVVASLPAMPGIDGDWAAGVMHSAALAAQGDTP